MTRRRVLAAGAVALGLVAVSLLHYLTPTDRPLLHNIYQRLYYLPVILGAVFFGLRGGLAASLAASAFYIPHIVMAWGNYPSYVTNQLLEVVLLNVLGGLVGYALDRERSQQRRLARTSARLADSLTALTAQREREQRYEAELRRSDRLAALGRMAAGVAHEVRNPLAAIRTSAQVLGKPDLAPAKSDELRRIIIDELDRLEHVVAGFLDFARPPAVVLAVLDITPLLEEVVTMLRTNQAGTRVASAIEAGLPPVRADRAALKQVFLNLGLNALQSLAGTGTLSIRARPDQGMVAVEFADDGPGIPPADLEHIFDPFFTTRPQGTGLGLAIAQRITEEHHGRLTVTSRPGQGATFRVLIPVDHGHA